jgi:hypothetical protein
LLARQQTEAAASAASMKSLWGCGGGDTGSGDIFLRILHSAILYFVFCAFI